MSEYQRYEFMTSNWPLTREELEAVNELSSHIEASSTHAVIEYEWGDFKHDPIRVLQDFFDGFLYWANWGAPRLAFRFPQGILPATLLDDYDCDDFVTFSRHKEHDILDICFGEMEAPEEWVDYELGSLMPVRDELMDGDLRALYIAWLAFQAMIGGYDDGAEDEYEVSAPPVPPGLATLTSAQQALAELLRVPDELLAAAARHSSQGTIAPEDDFALWPGLLPSDRQLVRELRELGQDKNEAQQSESEHVTFTTLVAESKGIKRQRERERLKLEQLAHQRRLQELHDHSEMFWRQAEQAASRGSGSGYDEATRVLVELRNTARHFNELEKFEAEYQDWVSSHLRRPSLLRRLHDEGFPQPRL